MSILLTNDDGVDAPGLDALATALVGLGELYVAAPATNQSGVGMAITIGRKLRLREMPAGPGGAVRRSLDGTPADAVKYGIQHLLKGKKPRLVVSGINHGPNLGINVRCSGTIGAACEAVVSGVPAVAVSVDYTIPPVWEGAAHYARIVAEKALAMVNEGNHGIFLLNLNVPALPPEKIKGLVLAPHGVGGFRDILAPREDAHYELEGEWITLAPESGCDTAALMAGYAVVTPFQLDMTHSGLMDHLKTAWRDDLAEAPDF